MIGLVIRLVMFLISSMIRLAITLAALLAQLLAWLLPIAGRALRNAWQAWRARQQAHAAERTRSEPHRPTGAPWADLFRSSARSGNDRARRRGMRPRPTLRPRPRPYR